MIFLKLGTKTFTYPKKFIAVYLEAVSSFLLLVLRCRHFSYLVYCITLCAEQKTQCVYGDGGNNIKAKACLVWVKCTK